MADIAQLERALINADKAGDADAARVFAAEIRKLRTSGAMNQAQSQSQEPSLMQEGLSNLKNLGAGLVRGAGSIGATLLYPIDKAQDLYHGDRNPNITGLVTGKQPISRNQERRQAIDAGLQTLVGADPNSVMYQVGKIGGEIAGTAGAGGALANGLSRSTVITSRAAPLLDAIRTGGFSVGGASGLPAVAARGVGGAINGGITAGMVNPEDAGLGAMVGGVLPVVASGVGRVAQAAGRSIRGGEISPEVRALAERAEQLGIRIPADRIGNSRPVNALAASLNYVPFSGRAATEDAMSAQLNRALSRTFGQDSDNITMALRQAGPALGGEFDRVLQSNVVNVDQQLIQELAEAANRAGRELGSDGASIIGRQVDDILEKAATGQIDGQAAYNIKRTLDRIGRRNTPEAFYANDLRRSLMGALNRSLGPDEAARFAQTRQQYGNMLDLSRLAKNGAEGEISVARLANMRDINNPQMQELADIAAQFVRQRESQHGAAQRVVLGTGAGLAGLMGGGIVGGAAGIAGAGVLGRGANALLNSDMARNVVLGNAAPAVENALARLLPATYRAAPVISAQ